MLKRIKYISAVLFIFIIGFSNTIVIAVEKEELKITSKAGIVLEQSTGRILWEKNSKERLKIASTTKILTAIVVVENVDLDSKVVISKKAALTGGSTVGLVSGKEVTVKSLLYGLLLKSGNDCAVALAEYVGGNVDEFVNMMNKKAYEIGAKDTHCTNPHGLDTEDNYSTAYDIAKITCYAKNIDILSKIMNTESITVNFGNTSKFLANTNRLLATYEYCNGGKTGYTAIANRCLVATAKKDNLEVVAVILGANTTDIRFKEGKALLKYAIENYSMVDVESLAKYYVSVNVIKGICDSYTDNSSIEIYIPLKAGELEKLHVKQDIITCVKAPLNVGDFIGNVHLYIGEELLHSKDIYAKYDIRKKDVKDYIILALMSIFQNDGID